MSLSFEDSLKKSMVATPMRFEAPVAATMSVADMNIADTGVMTLDETYGVAAYSGDGGNWQQHTDYVRYSVFSDDNIVSCGDSCCDAFSALGEQEKTSAVRMRASPKKRFPFIANLPTMKCFPSLYQDLRTW